MSFFVVPKPPRKPGSPVQRTYVDILYDHAGYLRANGGGLGPGSLAGRNVCVVGAGPAGLATAFLLTRQGATVTLLEASNRIGGRVDSAIPVAGDAARFEMGAMRVPPSEQLFGYFWNDVFGLPAPSVFPDPGKVDTKIVFQNQVYDWPAGGNPPAIFNNVSTAWNAFAGSQAFASIIANLTNPATFANVQPAWQKLVYQGPGLGPEQGYANISFFQGLVQAFVENYPTYGCAQWTSQDFALFGALGLGSGGFGPLYQVNFAEIVRLVLNGLETDQLFYSVGLSCLADSLANALPSGTIQLQQRVTAVNVHGGVEHNVRVTSVNASGAQQVTYFDAAVIATTTRSMQVDMDLTELPRASAGAGAGQKPSADVGAGRVSMAITNDQATAVQELHLMNSSKLFVLTQTKFWKSENLPQNIQTDGLVRGLYCLDYPNSNYGVVLVSYTWGDDSTKYIAIKDPNERFALLLRSLAPYTELAPFVSALSSQALQQYTTLVDWQDQRQYYGAFKLNYPGQDALNQSLYYQFIGSTNGVFLAGDSVGWCGGWIEGALQTAVNAAAAIVQRFCGPGGLASNSPMTQSPTQYSYGP